MIGDVRYAGAGDKLVPLLGDAAPRVQFFAAEALGRIAFKPAQAAIVAMLAQNADKDVYLRHAGSVALASIGDAPALEGLAQHESAAVRLAAVIALRRMRHAGVARFLSDADERIVTDAARAINDDGGIAAALPALGALLKETRFKSEPLLRRAISANLRVGSNEAAERVAAFAADATRASRLRVEAVSVARRLDGPVAARSRGRLLPRCRRPAGPRRHCRACRGAPPDRNTARGRCRPGDEGRPGRSGRPPRDYGGGSDPPRTAEERRRDRGAHRVVARTAGTQGAGHGSGHEGGAGGQGSGGAEGRARRFARPRDVFGRQGAAALLPDQVRFARRAAGRVRGPRHAPHRRIPRASRAVPRRVRSRQDCSGSPGRSRRRGAGRRVPGLRVAARGVPQGPLRGNARARAAAGPAHRRRRAARRPDDHGQPCRGVHPLPLPGGRERRAESGEDRHDALARPDRRSPAGAERAHRARVRDGDPDASQRRQGRRHAARRDPHPRGARRRHAAGGAPRRQDRHRRAQ